MKLELGGRRFGSKADLKEYVKAFIGRRGACEINNGDSDYEFLVALFQNKPSNVGATPTVFHIHKNQFTSKIDTISADGEPFSWNKCIAGRDSSGNEHLVEACRNAVTEQLFDFWRPDGKCAVCGGTDNLEIDHVNEFSTMFNSFWSGRTRPTEFVNNDKKVRVFADTQIMNEWQKYHKQNAILQYLCNKCHNTKTRNFCSGA